MVEAVLPSLPHACTRPDCPFVPGPRVSPAATEGVRRILESAGPDHEIELRFETDATFFAHATRMVEQCDDWETSEHDTLTDTFHGNHVRTRRSLRHGSVVHMRKETLDVRDVTVVPGPAEHSGFPRTVRVSVAREVPVDVDIAPVVPQRIRHQRRYSVVLRGFRFDLSTVRTGSTLVELEAAPETYIIEVEVTGTPERCLPHLATSLLYRVLGFAMDDTTHIP